MDFPLHVETYEVNGRLYRRNPYKRSRLAFGTLEVGGDTADLYGSEDELENCGATAQLDEASVESLTITEKSIAVDEGCVGTSSEGKTSNFPIFYNEKSKKWSTKVLVPSQLIKFIVGAKGNMKRKIEQETDCRLVIGSKNKERPIEIFAKSEDCVSRCKDRIELIAMNAREKIPYTHFISFYAAVEDIQKSFADFANLVKSDEELPLTCRDEDLFQEPKKLHFTIVMLSLLDTKEKEAAAKALEVILENKIKKLLCGQPLDVHIRGLEYMNDDPNRVRVLYAVAQSEKLQEVADEIAKGMSEAGFTREEQDSVKLHLTLMNTKFAWEKGKKIYMDVVKLIEKYGDFNFGKCTVAEVHISSLAEPKDDDGYYKREFLFKL